MRPDDLVAANRLLALSLARRSRPSAASDHDDLLVRFRTDPGYASAVRLAAEPLGLRVLGADPQLGLVLDTTADSVFSLRTDDLQRDFKWTSANERIIFGVAFVGIATYCFPTAGSFSESGIRHLTAVEVDEWIRRAAELTHDDTDSSGDEVAPEEALSIYVAEKAVSRNKGSDALRQDCTVYKVGRVLRWLADRGFMARDAKDKDRFRSTERYRLHVREVAANTVFQSMSHVMAQEEG